MKRPINPGYVIALFLNVVLLLGIPFFGEGEAQRLLPLILLALAFPWLLAWGVGRAVRGARDDAARKREEADRSDFV